MMWRFYLLQSCRYTFPNISIKNVLPSLTTVSLNCSNYDKNARQNYSSYYTNSHQKLLGGVQSSHVMMPYSKHDIDVKQFHVSNENFAIKAPSIDVGKAISSLKATQMINIKDAPVAFFWVGVGGLIPFAAPPIMALLFGYSPLLGAIQLAYGATVLAFVGGIKWGHMAPGDKANVTWDNVILGTIPSIVATSALVAPQLIGYVIVVAGLIVALAVDLTTSRYPPWLISLRSFLTTVSIAFLIMSMLQCLIN